MEREKLEKYLKKRFTKTYKACSSWREVEYTDWDGIARHVQKMIIEARYDEHLCGHDCPESHKDDKCERCTQLTKEKEGL